MSPLVQCRDHSESVPVVAALYWAHRFHHRFNSHVVPMSANAVSFVEYCFAYMLPFIVGCLLLKPDALALFAAASLISINNILIHTPSLEKISLLVVPWSLRLSSPKTCTHLA